MQSVLLIFSYAILNDWHEATLCIRSKETSYSHDGILERFDVVFICQVNSID